MRVLWSISVLVTLINAGVAEAKTALRCDDKQKFCVVDNKRLITGDKVMFLNEDEEIVALGEVSDMIRRDRKIEITKKYGFITSDVSVKRIDDGDRTSMPVSSFKTYRAPGRYSLGGSLGLTPMNIASDAVAYSGEGFGQYLWRDNLSFTGRIHGYSVSGVVDTGEQSTESVNYSVNGMLFLAGMAHKAFTKSPVALRTSFDLGFSYASVSTSGSASIKSIETIGNGFGLAGRLGADAIYTRLNDWQPLASIGFSQINGARGTTISAGVMKDLK